MKPWRTVIIGTGGIVKAHVEAVQGNRERAELVAAMDTDAARLAEFCAKHNIPRRYTDLAAMLAAERPELVQICSPPSVHCGQIVQSLEAGAWVFSEKPLCASLAEFDQITAAEKRTGRYCSCVFQWRFGSGGEHLRQLHQSGSLGRLLLGVCQTTWYRTMDYYNAPWRGKWRTEVGGTTMAHGIHAMDFFLWLFGDWAEVRAMAGTLDHPIEVDDVSLALVRMENGALVSFVNSAVSPRQESLLRFDFQRATVELRHLYQYRNADWHYSVADDSPYQAQLAEWARIPADHPGSQTRQLAAILDARERNQRPPVSGDESRRILEFVSALYKSAHTGQPVRRGSIQPGDPYYRHVSGQV